MKLSTLLLALKLLAILAGEVLALDQSPHCRIHVSEGNDYTSMGSGTLVGNFKNCGMIVTCSHLFDDGAKSIVCEFPTGEKLPAILLKQDKSHDLAVLQTAKPSVRGLEFGECETPKLVWVCGYGGQGQFRSARGPVLSSEMAVGAQHPHCVANVGVRSGDSGGAVLDENEKFVGVIWGCVDGQTRFFTGEPFWKIVTETQCYNGVCYGPSVRPAYPVNQSPPPAKPPSRPLAQQPAKPCECAEKWEAHVVAWKDQQTINHSVLEQFKLIQQKLTERDETIAALTTKLEAQATALAKVENNVSVIQETPTSGPSMDEIEAEMSKRLKHSAEWHRLDGKIETQTRPITEPLKFQSERVGIR